MNLQQLRRRKSRAPPETVAGAGLPNGGDVQPIRAGAGGGTDGRGSIRGLNRPTPSTSEWSASPVHCYGLTALRNCWSTPIGKRKSFDLKEIKEKVKKKCLGGSLPEAPLPVRGSGRTGRVPSQQQLLEDGRVDGKLAIGGVLGDGMSRRLALSRPFRLELPLLLLPLLAVACKSNRIVVVLNVS